MLGMSTLCTWHRNTASIASIADKNDNSEFVLQRDGEGVVVNSACVAQSGEWVSPYDNAVFTNSSKVDIDHMVPLKNAWIVSCLSTTVHLALFSLLSIALHALPQMQYGNHITYTHNINSPVPQPGPPASAKASPTTLPAPSFGPFPHLQTAPRATRAPISGSPP